MISDWCLFSVWCPPAQPLQTVLSNPNPSTPPILVNNGPWVMNIANHKYTASQHSHFWTPSIHLIFHICMHGCFDCVSFIRRSSQFAVCWANTSSCFCWAVQMVLQKEGTIWLTGSILKHWCEILSATLSFIELYIWLGWASYRSTYVELYVPCCKGAYWALLGHVDIVELYFEAVLRSILLTCKKQLFELYWARY